MTIFNTSKDQIFLKKIPLKIWRLRDEIESKIQVRTQKGEIKIEELEKEYSPQPSEAKTTGEVILPLETIPSEKTSFGKAIISEINMEGIRFFCNNGFLIGNSLVVEFQIPNKFRLNAVVLETKAYDLESKLISQKKLPYRLQLKWTFLKSGERTLLREFLQSISSVKPKLTEKVASEKKPPLEEKKSA